MKRDPPKILVAPLNWGLGHASRCIPIINTLISRGVDVSIATDGESLTLLMCEFPEINYYELPSYKVNYRGRSFTWNIIRQTPNFLKAIKRENRAIKRIINQNKIDIIISDNRYGCYSQYAHNIFITHQLRIKTTSSLLDIPINIINRRYLLRFDEIWVPDFYGVNSLAGDLSQHDKIKAKYIGPLSRLVKKPAKKKFDLAIVLSGPEPKRTELEEKIVSQCVLLSAQKIILIQGLPGNGKKIKTDLSQKMTMISFMTSEELNETLLSSDVIVARSGYSTIMDLWKIQKPALLIPTPGQTEQVHLADYLLRKKLFLTQSENELNFKTALNQIGEYEGFSDLLADNDGLEKAINSLLNRISSEMR